MTVLEAHSCSAVIWLPSMLTLVAQVCKDPELSDWQLFLVDWGYNTAPERARAAANPRISVIGVTEFAALLRGAPVRIP
jgi:hypothetical protein